MRYFPQLDGLRALCVAFTILNHIGPHPYYLNGNVGVDIFFVLSGFLITSLLEHERNNMGKVSLRAFYIRRAFRIVPLYYVMIVLYAVITYTLNRQGVDTARWLQFRASALPLIAFMGEYRPESAGSLFGHAWTLGIEEKYYVVWPLLLLGLQHLGVYLKYGIVSAMLVVSWVFLPALHEARGYGGLLAGSLVALINTDTNRKTADRMLALPSYWYLLAVLAGYALTVIYEGARIHVVITLAAAPFICKLVEAPGMTARVLAYRPFAFVGRRTYGIYLIHVLIANTVTAVVWRSHTFDNWIVMFGLTFGVSLIVASGLKATIESPLVAAGRLWSKRPVHFRGLQSNEQKA